MNSLHFRILGWILQAILTLNGDEIEQAVNSSTYTLEEGDVITLTLSASLRLKRSKDNPAMVSVFYGPLLLAGELGSDEMPDGFTDKDTYRKLPSIAVPEIVSASTNPADWLKPI